MRVSGPICVVSADFDLIQGRASGIDLNVARHYGADYFVLRGAGHFAALERGWERGADVLSRWLDRNFPAAA
jgi:hypothetical protein